MAFRFYSTIVVFVLFYIIFPLPGLAQLPACKDSFPASLFPNSSFEAYSGCNTDYSGLYEGGEIDADPNFGHITVNSWHSYLLGSPVHYCNYNCKANSPYSIFDTTSINNLPAYPAPHQPLPDGTGFIEIAQHYDTVGIQGSKISSDYITTCLTTPLYAGQPYLFSFYLGFGKTKTNYTPIIKAISPYTVAIFGREDCPSFPVATSNFGCLSKDPGWIQLGTATLTGNDEWVIGVIEFTPTSKIVAIGVGPDCYADNSGSFLLSGTITSHYLDKFILAPKADFSFKTITVISGNPCTGNFILKAPQYPAASYQWYKDGTLINNATSEEYTVPDNNAAGSYIANIMLPYNSCINTLPYVVEVSDIKKFTLNGDIILCTPQQATLNASWPTAVSYLWQDGSTNSSFVATSSGVYSVTIADKFGCRNEQKENVTIKNCATCKLYIPSAFTPNSDGLNDIFKVLPGCLDVGLRYFKLQVYNRFGQLIFTSYDLNKGWDGTFRNNLLETGSYVYIIDYSFEQGEPVSKKGVVELLR